MRGGDIEKYQLISALILIAPGELDRIALPFQVHELDSFDH